MSHADFAERLLQWFDVHGRHDLPWQHPRQAYRVWISEVMLQQTQVATVIPYFERFMARFPDVQALAAASQDEVLRHWAGLGYYARGRNLHRAAKRIVDAHGGLFPDDVASVGALPGVGRSTAAAILAQAFGQRHAILDGNVRRVLARHAGIEGWPGLPKVQARLWQEAEARLPHQRLADYTQALMDLGNAVCRARRPECARCAVREDCVARREDRVGALPTPRPPRIRPQRRAQVLLIVNARDELLLQRRPPAGIWGGLWCPPVHDADASWASLAPSLGFDAGSPRELAPLRHAFTHYDLDLLPLRLRAEPAATAVAENDARMWIKLSDPAAWPGLPAPMRKLIEALDRQATLEFPPSEDLPCREPSTASSSTRTPKDSTARPTPARSASASSRTSRAKPGSSGSSTRRG
jgi:A/G-specific adenine glycosylase